jgi:predicted dienelactone hydrolase
MLFEVLHAMKIRRENSPQFAVKSYWQGKLDNDRVLRIGKSLGGARGRPNVLVDV